MGARRLLRSATATAVVAAALVSCARDYGFLEHRPPAPATAGSAGKRDPAAAGSAGRAGFEGMAGSGGARMHAAGGRAGAAGAGRRGSPDAGSGGSGGARGPAGAAGAEGGVGPAGASGDGGANAGGAGGAGLGGAETHPPHIAVGSYHLCVISHPGRSGTIQCRGDNSVGQLGVGQLDDEASFGFPWREVVSAEETLLITGAETVAAGDWHTCALFAGEVRCWGSNKGYAAVPDPSDYLPLATRVPLFAQGAPLVVGGSYNCAGSPPYCWGDNHSSQIDDSGLTRLALTALGSSPEVLALGQVHTCMASGTHVECWGGDDYHQCGTPVADTCPDREGCIAPRTVVPSLAGARALALGSHHSCSIDPSGAVWCWGSNSYGELGSPVPSACPIGPVPSAECSLAPTQVLGLTGARALALGEFHTCAIVGDEGRVYCWGHNETAELGRYTGGVMDATPLPVLTDPDDAPLDTAVGLSARGRYTCAELESGDFTCWGDLSAADGTPILHAKRPSTLSLQNP